MRIAVIVIALLLMGASGEHMKDQEFYRFEWCWQIALDARAIIRAKTKEGLTYEYMRSSIKSAQFSPNHKLQIRALITSHEEAMEQRVPSQKWYEGVINSCMGEQL